MFTWHGRPCHSKMSWRDVVLKSPAAPIQVDSFLRKSFVCDSYEAPTNINKTRHFNPIICHSCGNYPCKPFVCHSYKKPPGWGTSRFSQAFLSVIF